MVRRGTALTALVLLSSAASGCGRTEHFIAEEVLPYLGKFLDEASARCLSVEPDVSIYFVSESDIDPGEWSSAVGNCEIFSNHIEIRRSYWENANETEREILLFHELGHCLLSYYYHTDTGLMREYLMPASVYLQDRTNILDQLYRSSASCKEGGA